MSGSAGRTMIMWPGATGWPIGIGATRRASCLAWHAVLIQQAWSVICTVIAQRNRPKASIVSGPACERRDVSSSRGARARDGTVRASGLAAIHSSQSDGSSQHDRGMWHGTHTPTLTHTNPRLIALAVVRLNTTQVSPEVEDVPTTSRGAPVLSRSSSATDMIWMEE